jgi:excisionase family DNA binding protein
MEQSSRMSINEIAGRLSIGRLMVYSMLEQGIIPGIRIGAGQRWLVTRYAYTQWENTCGMRPVVSEPPAPECAVIH